MTKLCLAIFVSLNAYAAVLQEGPLVIDDKGNVASVMRREARPHQHGSLEAMMIEADSGFQRADPVKTADATAKDASTTGKDADAAAKDAAGADATTKDAGADADAAAKDEGGADATTKDPDADAAAKDAGGADATTKDAPKDPATKDAATKDAATKDAGDAGTTKDAGADKAATTDQDAGTADAAAKTDATKDEKADAEQTPADTPKADDKKTSEKEAADAKATDAKDAPKEPAGNDKQAAAATPEAAGTDAKPDKAGAADTRLTHVNRADLTYNFVEEKMSGACDSHFEYMGELTNDQCAQKCYETYGCTRFSAGGCSLGCRISKLNSNSLSSSASPPDGQCPTSSLGESSSCMVFKLAFFHADAQPGSCSSHFELVSTAQSKAQCAHTCKNTPGCKKFSAEPNCMEGCRISKCNSNAGSNACPADSQCTTAANKGCTTYTLFR